MQIARALVVLIFACPTLPHPSQAQAVLPLTPQTTDTSVRRFEVGASVSNIRTGCVDDPYCHIPSVGVGLGAAINLDRRFALDGNVNLTSTADSDTNNYGGRLSEYLFGARLETRAKHYGFFIKAQPGLVNWSHVITQVYFPTPSTVTFAYGGVNHFVTEMGAGFEYSPTSRIHVRTEGSDLLMRYGSGSWAHNLQSTVGVYVGLGKPIAWKPPVYDARESHRFFDPTNEVLITGNALAWTADAITTQRFLAHGLTEKDPFAKPFVTHGWGGEVADDVLETAVVTLAMYGLHRIHQHWIERLIPVGSATGHGYCAYHNTKLSSNSVPTP